MVVDLPRRPSRVLWGPGPTPCSIGQGAAVKDRGTAKCASLSLWRDPTAQGQAKGLIVPLFSAATAWPSEDASGDVLPRGPVSWHLPLPCDVAWY